LTPGIHMKVKRVEHSRN